MARTRSTVRTSHPSTANPPGHPVMDRSSATLRLREHPDDRTAPATARCSFNLGCMYYIGEGTDVNKAQAAQCFRQAALHGHKSAAFNLGLMFFNGDGVPKIYTMALRMLEPLINDDNSGDVANIMGVIYFRGQSRDDVRREIEIFNNE
jgi:hypothetical protein